MQEEVLDAPRFGFGQNWRSFVGDIDELRIRDAEDSLRRMLPFEDLNGRTFLDVGCGSGLFSLAAARLGAERIRSFDYDADSVRATQELRQRRLDGAPWADTPWVIECGDVTNSEYVASLGAFDIVYAWGVLHHTGAMWRAIDNAIGAVGPGGLFFVAIYNNQGVKSRAWLAVKKLYNRLPRPLRAPYAILAMLPMETRSAVAATVKGHPLAYVRSWTKGRERGMSRWHDLIDWVGGYPFEVATLEDMFTFCHERGLELTQLSSAGGSLGCNQFVFRRAVA